MSCHPTLSRDNQIALTLKVVAGLQAAEIARAFLISETTAAQRIVRAKRSAGLRPEARFEMPAGGGSRPGSAWVLAVIYADFQRGLRLRRPGRTGPGPSSATTPSGSAGGGRAAAEMIPRPAAWWP